MEWLLEMFSSVNCMVASSVETLAALEHQVQLMDMFNVSHSILMDTTVNDCSAVLCIHTWM